MHETLLEFLDLKIFLTLDKNVLFLFLGERLVRLRPVALLPALSLDL